MLSSRQGHYWTILPYRCYKSQKGIFLHISKCKKRQEFKFKVKSKPKGRNRIVFLTKSSSYHQRPYTSLKHDNIEDRRSSPLSSVAGLLSSVAGLLLASLCPSFNQELQVNEFCCCVDFICWIFDLYFRWKSSYGTTNVREKCTKTSRNFTR
ncbi:hypothetical protein L1887_03468 [Cichorium endivia]|nr:hypothetical protein L1887_03468 [Cichorium endivia]